MRTKIEEYLIEEVKKRRLAQNMSQATLACYLNVSAGFIGNVENSNSRAKYNINHINELAKAFNCTPGELLPPVPFEDNMDGMVMNEE